MLARRGEHPMGFGRGHRHPRFREDVLAGFECGQRDRAVQVGPGADDDGVDPRVGDQVFPAVERARDAELAGRRRRGLRPAVADGDDLDLGDRPQAGDVTRSGVGPGADEADAQRGHDPFTGYGHEFDRFGEWLWHRATRAAAMKGDPHHLYCDRSRSSSTFTADLALTRAWVANEDCPKKCPCRSPLARVRVALPSSRDPPSRLSGIQCWQ